MTGSESQCCRRHAEARFGTRSRSFYRNERVDLLQQLLADASDPLELVDRGIRPALDLGSWVSALADPPPPQCVLGYNPSVVPAGRGYRASSAVGGGMGLTIGAYTNAPASYHEHDPGAPEVARLL